MITTMTKNEMDRPIKAYQQRRRRKAEQRKATAELMEQLARYGITDLDAAQADSERQFLADTVRNFLAAKMGIDRLYDFAAVIQAAHAAATANLMEP